MGGLFSPSETLLIMKAYSFHPAMDSPHHNTGFFHPWTLSDTYPNKHDLKIKQNKKATKSNCLHAVEP